MAKPRPGLGASLAIRDAAEQIERQRMQTHQEQVADNHLLPDDALRQLLTECPSNRAAIILKIDRHLIAGLRERLAAPDPWPGRPYPYLLAAGRIAQQRWGMWQETIPPPIGHEELEQLITSESAKGMTAAPGADPLTTFGVLAAIRTFHDEHSRWPTRAELAVAMRRAELDVKSKLGLLTRQGYADQDGQTFVPTDTAPASPQVTVTKWTREEIDAKFAQFAADKAPVSSPWAGRPKVSARTAKRPAVTTPQEVQVEMKGTRNPNRPADDVLVQLVESLIGQNITAKAAIAVAAVKLQIPETSAHTWYYAAQKLKKQQGEVTAPAAPAPDDDDLFADPSAPPITPPVVAALVPEQVIGGDGSTEHADASAGLTDGENGNLLAGGLTVEEAAAAVATLSTFSPVGQPLEHYVNDLTGYRTAVAAAPCFGGPLAGPVRMSIPGGGLFDGQTYTMVPKAEHEATQKRIVDLEIEAMQLVEKRSIIAAKQGTIDKLEAETAELRAAYEGMVASYHNLQVATANNANVASLMAENADLQAGLKEALQTIEQSGLEASTTYLLNHGETIEPVAVEPDLVLSEGDEYPHLDVTADKRRYALWHCTDTISLPGGHVICILRPGAAETAGQEAA